jgi:hypothetical protein
MTFGIIHPYLISADHLLVRVRHGSVALNEAMADAPTERGDFARRLHQSVAQIPRIKTLISAAVLRAASLEMTDMPSPPTISPKERSEFCRRLERPVFARGARTNCAPDFHVRAEHPGTARADVEQHSKIRQTDSRRRYNLAGKEAVQ